MCKHIVFRFVALKRPQNVDGSKGTSFVYFDSTQKNWKESKRNIDHETSAIGATIKQLYGVKKVRTISYV